MIKTTLYIVRHGETNNNNLHRFIGSTDHPLNERGQAQAATLNAPMSRLHIDRIYSSPYLRTMMTAEQIRAGREIEIIPERGLCEIHCGQWEGLNRAEIEERWPGMIDLWQFKPDLLRMPDGETFEQVRTRAVDALCRIVQENRGKSVAIASHMLTIQLIMTRLLNIPIRDVWEMVRLENTSITTMEVWENGDFEVTHWADEDHLPAELKNSYVKIAGFVTKNFKAKYDLSSVMGLRHFDGFAEK